MLTNDSSSRVFTNKEENQNNIVKASIATHHPQKHHELIINGVQVMFPYPPYDTQIDYMTSVIKALMSSSHALLESPTGTGKTLCMLCATLGYLQHMKQNLSTSLVGKSLTASIPTILYTSRTHSQLAQVVREFQKTAYSRNMQMAILGSRQHLCVNSAVSTMSGELQGHQCAQLRTDEKCRFYRGLRHFMEGEKREKAMGNIPNIGLYDIEDLCTLAHTQNFCPFFYERQLAETADIIFLPYQYIFDRTLHSQLPCALQEATSETSGDGKPNILIVDEAHNVPSALGSAGSSSLSPIDITSAIKECGRAIAIIEGDVERAKMDQSILAPIQVIPGRKLSSSRGKPGALENTITHEEIILLVSKLKLCLINLEEAIGTEQPPHSQTKTKDKSVRIDEFDKPGSYIFQFLAAPGIDITLHNFEHGGQELSLSSLIQTIIQIVSDMSGKSLAGTSSTGAGLRSLHTFLMAVFGTGLDAPDINCSCRFVIQPFKGTGRVLHSNVHRTLAFWCLDVTIPMKGISEKFRQCLFTSGTLSPMDHFAAELGLNFEIFHQGKHVINSNVQIRSICLFEGPDGKPLNSSYAFRGKEEYYSSLGKMVANISMITPDGMLIFFPSYGSLNSVINSWKGGHGDGTIPQGNDGPAQTLWAQISELKTIFVEPLTSADLVPVIKEFQEVALSLKGAILMAVARGKVSEGVDFSDRHARCVIVNGIPFANFGDLFVTLKRQFITDVAPTRPKVDGKLFTGDDWYKNEAIRCVNQCVGRVIRHKDDFGCIILADTRFNNYEHSISRWVTHDDSGKSIFIRARKFIECYQPVAQFFASKKVKLRCRVSNDHITEHNTANGSGPYKDVSSQGGTPVNADMALEYMKRCREKAASAVYYDSEAGDIDCVNTSSDHKHSSVSANIPIKLNKFSGLFEKRDKICFKSQTNLSTDVDDGIQKAIASSSKFSQIFGSEAAKECINKSKEEDNVYHSHRNEIGLPNSPITTKSHTTTTLPKTTNTSKEFLQEVKTRFTSERYSKLRAHLTSMALISKRKTVSTDDEKPIKDVVSGIVELFTATYSPLEITSALKRMRQFVPQTLLNEYDNSCKLS